MGHPKNCITFFFFENQIFFFYLFQIYIIYYNHTLIFLKSRIYFQFTFLPEFIFYFRTNCYFIIIIVFIPESVLSLFLELSFIFALEFVPPFFYKKYCFVQFLIYIYYFIIKCVFVCYGSVSNSSISLFISQLLFLQHSSSSLKHIRINLSLTVGGK